jgi:carbon storage regulator
MLVLTRRLDEKIKIGNDIVISIERIRPDNVRIGIEAPKQIPISRTELLDCDNNYLTKVHSNGDEPLSH